MQLTAAQPPCSVWSEWATLSCTKNSVKCSCCLSERELTGFQSMENGNKKCHWKRLVPSWRSYWCLLSGSDYLARPISTISCLFTPHYYLHGSCRPFHLYFLKLSGYKQVYWFMWQLTKDKPDFTLPMLLVHIYLICSIVIPDYALTRSAVISRRNRCNLCWKCVNTNI